MSDEADDYSDLPDDGTEDTTDIDRYDTAAGWEPPDQYKKLRDDYVKKHPLEFFHGTIFAREDFNKVFHPETPVVEQKQLFGDLVRTGELTVLFSDTGLGKSILAVQIGDATARGVDAMFCAGTRASTGAPAAASASGVALPASPKGETHLHNDAGALRVLYIDFEMTRSQFAERYSCGIKNRKYLRPYKFRNMERLFVNWEDPLPEGFKNGTEFITHSIWKEVRDTEPGLLIVDNISYLVSSPASAREASRLMKQLNAMKREFGLSILVLAHTPKRSLAKYLSINDMAGRKELGNFIDNSFAIGRSHREEGLRYIKQMKQRNRPETFGEDSVIVCRLAKPKNFPRFEFVEFGPERPHLLRPFDHPEGTATARENLIAEVRRLHAAGYTQRQIAIKLGISLGAVNKYLADDH